jgi:hypothetical protein
MNQPDGPAAVVTEAAVPAVAPAAPAPVSSSDRVPVLAWVIAAGFVAVELAVSGRYGFQQDELYFIEAGRHLAFGYVDQPPMVPLLSRVTGVLGVSPAAVRVIPALAGGAVVVAAPRFAALLGASRFGRVLAALATACAPVIIGATHIGNSTSASPFTSLCDALPASLHRPGCEDRACWGRVSCRHGLPG